MEFTIQFVSISFPWREEGKIIKYVRIARRLFAYNDEIRHESPGTQTDFNSQCPRKCLIASVSLGINVQISVISTMVLVSY